MLRRDCCASLVRLSNRSLRAGGERPIRRRRPPFARMLQRIGHKLPQSARSGVFATSFCVSRRRSSDTTVTPVVISPPGRATRTTRNSQSGKFEISNFRSTELQACAPVHTCHVTLVYIQLHVDHVWCYLEKRGIAISCNFSHARTTRTYAREGKRFDDLCNFFLHFLYTHTAYRTELSVGDNGRNRARSLNCAFFPFIYHRALQLSQESIIHFGIVPRARFAPEKKSKKERKKRTCSERDLTPDPSHVAI